MRITTILVLAGVAAGLIAGCGAPPPVSTSDGPARQAAAVGVQTVAETESPTLYEATGSVKARLNATLSTKVMARVATVTVREGDEIHAGQVLVSLDPRELAAGVQLAQANLKASSVGVDNARTARLMEEQSSKARIGQAQAAVAQSKAALSAAQAKLDLALAGPRVQERAQASLAVTQAEANLKLAKTQLDRISNLVAQGAMPQKDLDAAQTSYEVALAQRDTAVQSEKIAIQGTRTEDISAARQMVAQAQAAVKQAEAGLAEAKAAALQTRVRAEQIKAAQAQVSQSSAALSSAQVALGYATIQAPFEGRVVQRTVDPGAMATPGSPLLTVEGGELRLEIVVPESVLEHVHKGQSVAVKLDATGQSGFARVSEIVPQGDPMSHSFIVKLSLDGLKGTHSGMFGRGYIETGRSKKIEVPSAAVWVREGLHFVYVVNAEGIARLRLVTAGDSTDERTTILSGLSPGDRIVTSGRENLSDGDKVAIR